MARRTGRVCRNAPSSRSSRPDTLLFDERLDLQEQDQEPEAECGKVLTTLSASDHVELAFSLVPAKSSINFQMPKPHASLLPSTNILLILVWAMVAALFFFVIEPHAPIVLGVIGACFGASGGTMQNLSLREAAAQFTSTASLAAVRRTLAATNWGKRYLRFLWSSKLLLIIFSFLIVREPWLAVVFGYTAAYFTLMCVREIVTLRATFFLCRVSDDGPSNISKSV